MPPKVIAKNNDRPGVLPVNAAARAASTKSSPTRLKLEIRRLPPGLTLTEFEELLGDEWKLGKGKVDWREYRQGKLRAPGKIPEQRRCYIHLANEALVKDFEQKFLSVVFRDKAGTHRNADIKHLPPTLGFAPNQRTPLQVKQRHDSRQGTIDQDPEFIAFLEAETQPLAKPPALDVLGVERTKGPAGVKSTPLIEDLREKKAQRAKAAAEKGDKKKADEKKGAHANSDSKDGVGVSADKDGRASQQSKVEQAAKEAAKVLNKHAAASAAGAKATSLARSKKAAQSPRQQNATPALPASTVTSNTASASPAPDRRPPHQRQRGNADGIKKMLQKDLGIRPKPASTAQPTTAQAPQPEAATPATTPTSPPASTAQQTTPTPPTTIKPTPTHSLKSTPTPPPTPHPTCLKAYLKHANPSQGMTEILILRALAEYGDVTNVTIDPRKGTAIALFKDNEGLRKAMQARRVGVGRGAVEVLEFREKGGGEVQGIGGRGGGGARGRGGFRGGRVGGGRGGVGVSAGPVASAGAGSAAS